MYSSVQNISTSSYIIGLMIPLNKARNVDNRTLYAQSRYVLILEYSTISSRRRGRFLLISHEYFMGQLRMVILNASYTKFPIVIVSKIGSELYVISGFRREVDEIGVPLGCYAAYSGNSLQTFRDNISVLLSKVKKSRIS